MDHKSNTSICRSFEKYSPSQVGDSPASETGGVAFDASNASMLKVGSPTLTYSRRLGDGFFVCRQFCDLEGLFDPAFGLLPSANLY